jgi:hypothetical protein
MCVGVFIFSVVTNGFLWMADLNHDASAAGLILYVDKDAACPGNRSSSSPYCSIQNAFNNVTAWDTIRIRNRATPYDENTILTRSGARFRQPDRHRA